MFPFSFRYRAPLACARVKLRENGERGTSHGNRELKLKVGLKFKLSFVPIFHFPVPRACSLLLVLRFSNIHLSVNSILSLFHFYFIFLFILLSFIITQKINHNIAGPLCFSGDVIKRNILLPKVL